METENIVAAINRRTEAAQADIRRLLEELAEQTSSAIADLNKGARPTVGFVAQKATSLARAQARLDVLMDLSDEAAE